MQPGSCSGPPPRPKCCRRRSSLAASLAGNKTSRDRNRSAGLIAWSGNALRGDATSPGNDLAYVESWDYAHTACRNYMLHVARHLWMVPAYSVGDVAEYTLKSKAKKLY